MDALLSSFPHLVDWNDAATKATGIYDLVAYAASFGKNEIST